MGSQPLQRRPSPTRADETAKVSGLTQVPWSGLPPATLRLISCVLLLCPSVKWTRTPEKQLLTFISFWVLAFLGLSLQGPHAVRRSLGNTALGFGDATISKGCSHTKGPVVVREAPGNTKEMDFQESDSSFPPGSSVR